MMLTIGMGLLVLGLFVPTFSSDKVERPLDIFRWQTYSFWEIVETGCFWPPLVALAACLVLGGLEMVRFLESSTAARSGRRVLYFIIAALAVVAMSRLPLVAAERLDGRGEDWVANFLSWYALVAGFYGAGVLAAACNLRAAPHRSMWLALAIICAWDLASLVLFLVLAMQAQAGFWVSVGGAAAAAAGAVCLALKPPGGTGAAASPGPASPGA